MSHDKIKKKQEEERVKNHIYLLWFPLQHNTAVRSLSASGVDRSNVLKIAFAKRMFMSSTVLWRFSHDFNTRFYL